MCTFLIMHVIFLLLGELLHSNESTENCYQIVKVPCCVLICFSSSFCVNSHSCLLLIFSLTV